ncbi:hypothetical protein N7509_003873 [Penicillium cosmopolitanum]|uniref:Aminoglycoside phosphotransferase domain-containing protein n=1 Tax=Penicillium cosmopolitanum TaxID=1131564 RepID=A0A9W9W5Y3_9EURO|nr:uncharacterized protein N7509_003873 [Penicillium cosmopolitanum]KAJ5404002.1 hypothetical protein N7509_003873 [Penicillium cosmopolitanum]
MMNPYKTDPKEIPTTDIYADVPLYSRYYPKPDDFRVNFQHINSQTTDSASIISLCTEEIQIYPANERGRDIFALRGMIVKSSHLHARNGTTCIEINYSYADANEIRAITLAKTALNGVRVPEIYFAGKINGRQVLVQERLPGVGLSVAWPYLSKDQRESYKKQAREILHQLHTLKPTENLQTRSHIVSDPNILVNSRINPLEGEILFSSDNHNPDISFMHNDFTTSNCIVNSSTIIGLIDWEMAGYFGDVHRRIRTPQREHFVNAHLREDELQDIMFWNNLYDVYESES